MREVAELAGVGMSSVSRVLSNHPDASKEMRARVMEAVERLGYKPNLLAQSLRRQETLSVGFVVGDISNPLLAEIVSGAETTLREAGYSMLLTDSENRPELDAEHIHLLEQRRVDGLILSTAKEGYEPTLDVLRGLEIPIAVVDRELPPEVHASRALSDHRRGVGDAVRHLLRLGHRRIGLIVGQPVRPSTERRRALELVYEEEGLEPTYTVLADSFTAAHGEQATRWLLELPHPPTAIIVGGNQLLLGSLRVISGRGIELGRDLSFVACDDVAVTELYQPPIAVVRRDNMALGRAAAELLLRRMRGEAEPAELVLPTEFVPRRSCGPPRA
jgi:LacI family transcriptional regulator